MNKIQIKNITKKYNNLTALDDVSFSFEFGKIYGLLGRNGAGKSTLINIIANRIFADEGMILVDDIPAKENMQVPIKMSLRLSFDKAFITMSLLIPVLGFVIGPNFDLII